MTTERLFSYGTLQLLRVQIETFGRELEGQVDSLVGWAQDFVEITDPEVLRKSDQTHHPILRYTGHASDRVSGTVFKITAQELLNADSYEVDDYKRAAAQTASGLTVWVYVEAASHITDSD